VAIVLIHDSIPVMPARLVPSPYWGAGIQELQAEASSKYTWIPAFAGMTPCPFISQSKYPKNKKGRSMLRPYWLLNADY